MWGDPSGRIQIKADSVLTLNLPTAHYWPKEDLKRWKASKDLSWAVGLIVYTFGSVFELVILVAVRSKRGRAMDTERFSRTL